MRSQASQRWVAVQTSGRIRCGDQSHLSEFPPCRKSSFTIGSTYRVLGTGKLWTYLGDVWSRTNGMTGYSFLDEQGRDRRWDISDDSDIGKWSQTFAPLT